MDKTKSILEYLDEIEAEDFSLVKEDRPYEIRSRQEAEQILSRYKRILAEAAAAKREADIYLEGVTRKYNDYLNTAVQPLHEQADYLEGLLRQYTDTILANTNKRSIKLVNGTLQLRKAQPKFERDEGKILDYIMNLSPHREELDRFVKPQPSKLDWKGLKEECETNNGCMFYKGEVIPYVEVQEVGPTLIIK